jgi:hypothetical protein
MATISPDDKKTVVMIYTQNMLVHGEVVTKQGVRVSTWLRTVGVPEYIHLFTPKVILFGSGAVKNFSYNEIFVPVTSLIAFHLAPPATDPMDYGQDETNRVMAPVTVLVGTFIFKGHLRISSKADVSTTIELAHSAWLSLYDVDISNPFMPQMQPMHVAMLVVNPKQIHLAVES